MTHQYSLRTHFIWDIEKLFDRVNTWLQHRRVRSQLRDINREEYP